MRRLMVLSLNGILAVPIITQTPSVSRTQTSKMPAWRNGNGTPTPIERKKILNVRRKCRRERAYAGGSAGSLAGAGCCLRDFRHSSNRCRTTKNDGTNSTARQVEAIMPLNTVMPIDLARAGAGAGRHHQRRDAEDEGEGGHQDRPEAGARRLDRRFDDRLAGGAHLARHLDDQDRVLGRQRDQQDQADLDVEVVVDAEAVEHRRPARSATSAPRAARRPARSSSRTGRRARDRPAAAPCAKTRYIWPPTSFSW